MASASSTSGVPVDRGFRRLGRFWSLLLPPGSQGRVVPCSRRHLRGCVSPTGCVYSAGSVYSGRECMFRERPSGGGGWWLGVVVPRALWGVRGRRFGWVARALLLGGGGGGVVVAAGAGPGVLAGGGAVVGPGGEGFQAVMSPA